MSGYSRRPIIKIGFMNLFGILTAKRLWEVSHGKNDGSSIKILSYIGTALDRYIENLRNLPNLIFVCLGAIEEQHNRAVQKNGYRNWYHIIFCRCIQNFRYGITDGDFQ